MSAHIIDGKEQAEKLKVKIKQTVVNLFEKNVIPGLAVVLVGHNPASEVYVKNKIKQTKDAGMNSFEYRLPDDTSEKDLLSLINQLNADQRVDGILVQLPLPDHIQEKTVLEAINPSKDVDGFHPINIGHLMIGAEGLVPCTPLGCIILLKSQLGNLTGMNAVVLGRSNIVGKPVAQLLLRENCTVTIAHSHTKHIEQLCSQADILIAAVGRPEFVRGSWIKKGAVVIDVGINRIAAPELGEGKTRLVGDVFFSEAVENAGAITPVPGGVGPMTIACLLRNTVVASCLRRGWDAPKI